jgi:hypothetical protein
MPTVLLTILVAATALILFFAGTRLWARGADQPSSTSAEPPAVSQPAPPKPADPMKPLTRDEIARKLKELADEPAPANLKKYSAMCYEQVSPADTIDYVCPKDGSRTQYAKSGPAGYDAVIQQLVVGARVGNFKGLELGVDGTEFCKKCSPGQKDPKPVLVVKIGDGSKEHRFRGVTYEDILLLRAFAGGKQTVEITTGQTTTEVPLKNYLPRLQELLDATLPK